MDQIQLAQQICQESTMNKWTWQSTTLHPFAVADMCETEEEKVCRHHDVPEDSVSMTKCIYAQSDLEDKV